MSNKLVWSNNMTMNSLAALKPEDLRVELIDYGYDEELINTLTDDELYDKIVYADDILWQVDDDRFNWDIEPMINKQTCDGIVLMVGKAARWDGNRPAGKAVFTESLRGGDIDPDVDVVRIEDDGEGLVWLGSHHDGTHKFKLYALPEENQVEFIQECMEDAINDEMMWYHDEENLDDAYDDIIEDILARFTDLDYLNDYISFNLVPSFCKRIKNESNIAVGENLEEEVLDEANTKEPKKLAKELKEIKKLANEYGYEYLTSMPFSNFDNDPISIEYNYPEFSKIVKAFFVEMGDMTREEAKTDIDTLDLLWDQNISQHDWDTIIRTCEYLLNHKNAQIEKIYKTGYNSFLDDDQILADREGNPDFEESLQEATGETITEGFYLGDNGKFYSKPQTKEQKKYAKDEKKRIKSKDLGLEAEYILSELEKVSKIKNKSTRNKKLSAIEDEFYDDYYYSLRRYEVDEIENKLKDIYKLDESLNEDIVQSYETMLPGETIDDYIKDAKKYNITIKKDPDLPEDIILSGNREDLRRYYAAVLFVDMDDDAVDVISESKFNKYYSYNITNGDITNTVTQVGEYFYTIKRPDGKYIRNISANRDGKDADKLFTAEEVEAYKRGMNMWIVDETMHNEEVLREGAAEEIKMHEFKEEIVDYIYNSLLEEIDTNLAPEIASKFGQYDLEWCNDEGDNFEARKIENHKKQLARAIADSLFKYAPREL